MKFMGKSMAVESTSVQACENLSAYWESLGQTKNEL